MKLIISILLVFISTILYSQQLNDYGHIFFDNQTNLRHQILKDNQPKVAIKQTSSNNTDYQLKNGTLRLENTCGNTPTTIKFFDREGVIINTLKFDQTINLKINSSKQFIYFQNGEHMVILDTKNFKKKEIKDTQILTITKNGKPIYYDNGLRSIIVGNKSFKVSFKPITIESSNVDEIYVFGKNNFAQIINEEVITSKYKIGRFFESKLIDDKVYFVTKEMDLNIFNFHLQSINKLVYTVIENVSLDMDVLSKNLDHFKSNGIKISCPMNPDSTSYPFRIGNSYAQYQKYGGDHYLHPGIDILGYEDQPVYSPVSGVVKAVLTIGGKIYWRLALGLSDTKAEQDGYLFAHLDPSTIPYSVGDSVIAGSYLGSLVYWPTYDFHHLHFARIKDSGDVWHGNWTTKDNVLKDIINYRDDTKPVFDKLWEGNTIGFRSEITRDILSPENLKGKFDIVCNIYDHSNSDYKIDVNSIWYEIVDLNIDSLVYKQHSYTYDFELDHYIDRASALPILKTIYSTYGLWTTEGNYTSRNFFQQISRSNGDVSINELDQDHYFDSTQLPNGSYAMKVCADDAAGNINCTELEITINNENKNTEGVNNEAFSIYPNPSTGRINIICNLSENLNYKILDAQGRHIDSGLLFSNISKPVDLKENGIYFVNIYDREYKTHEYRKILISN